MLEWGDGSGKGRDIGTFGISFLDVFCLGFFDCAVVIDENEGILVFWVDIALCALVSRAEVALEVWSGGIHSRSLVHTDGSYSGRVILEGDSCWPLRTS